MKKKPPQVLRGERGERPTHLLPNFFLSFCGGRGGHREERRKEEEEEVFYLLRKIFFPFLFF